ncbi:MAG TPA: D-alanyl-D-alanine carboxypeptidase [Firmicutes bacterium]|nr:D-alanyl-D-alanine carboxypeptidase [Bacillota bacterium]
MFATSKVYAYKPAIDAKAAILVDASTGQVLYEKNVHTKVPPASITKIMTMLLVMEDVEAGKVKLTDTVRTSTYASSIGGSQIWLKEGEEMPLEDMMKAIAIVSANDASTAVAEYIAGSQDDFVAMMNERAKQLGMRDTHFANPDGLPAPDHYSSAYDISVMARELLKHPKVLEWTSQWLTEIPRPAVPEGVYPLKNTNELIKRYRGADGLKTGMTEEAGYCLVGTARRDDFRLISVVLGADSDEARVTQSIKLLDYGFRNFARIPIAKKGEKVADAKVAGGTKETVPAIVRTDFGVVVERGKEDFIDKAFKQQRLTAPVKKGQKVGEYTISLEGKELAKIDAVAGEDVGRANILVVIFRGIRNFFARLFGLTS